MSGTQVLIYSINLNGSCYYSTSTFVIKESVNVFETYIHDLFGRFSNIRNSKSKYIKYSDTSLKENYYLYCRRLKYVTPIKWNRKYRSSKKLLSLVTEFQDECF